LIPPDVRFYLLRSPRPLAVFKGPTSKGKEGEERGWEEGGEGKARVEEWKGGKEKEQKGRGQPPPPNILA